MRQSPRYRLPMMSIMLTVGSMLLTTTTRCLALQQQQRQQQPESSNISRRRWLLGSSSSLIGTTATFAALVSAPAPASAARGAAELDFEYYMRDAFGGNQKGGNIQPSAPLAVPPPRTLQGPLLSLLLNDDCTPSCLPVQALMQQIQLQKNRQNENPEAIALDISDRVRLLKEQTKRSFFARSPWREEHVSDQYYFDFTAYALWRVTAELLPDYVERDKFVRNLGKLLYQQMVADGILKIRLDDQKNKKGMVSSALPATLELLQVFQTSQFCKGYRIRGGDEDADYIFDDLDDESLKAGGTVDCLVSVYEPATLGASLQITGEQSRFGPDFVGATLAALWGDESMVGLQSSWETFFVDPEYRPNPKDYFPNEQLLQYTLSSRRK